MGEVVDGTKVRVPGPGCQAASREGSSSPRRRPITYDRTALIHLVEGNLAELVVGNAFSIEPGIYLAGRFGFRLEDIVVIDGSGGAERLNHAGRSLAVVR